MNTYIAFRLPSPSWVWDDFHEKLYVMSIRFWKFNYIYNVSYFSLIFFLSLSMVVIDILSHWWKTLNWNVIILMEEASQILDNVTFMLFINYNVYCCLENVHEFGLLATSIPSIRRQCNVKPRMFYMFMFSVQEWNNLHYVKIMWLLKT